MDNLQWLQEWYLKQCDGDWEHDFGMHIETLDNPGWSVVIHITNTGLEDKHFEKIKIENSESDWIHCMKDELTFKGYCGPKNLNEVIYIFRDWVENIKR